MVTDPPAGGKHPLKPENYPVLVVDDHELFSTALVIALRNHRVNAEQLAALSKDAILAAATSRPAGLVVLDLNLGRDAEGHWRNGHDVVQALRSHGWKVLVVSGSFEPDWIAPAIAAGAIGVVAKSASFDALLNTVLTAAAGKAVMSEDEHRTWLHLHRRHNARERELTLQFGKLSDRERAVLEMLADGHRAATIAEKSSVSLVTVRSQIRSILAKLAVHSQLEAVALIRERPRWYSRQPPGPR
ncbi:MAG: LuxR C-terminal-related transcriptional regulator [Pseudonocardiaceae bacterium]